MIISFNLIMITAAAVLAGSLLLSLTAIGIGWRARRRAASAVAAAGIAGLRAAEAEAAPPSPAAFRNCRPNASVPVPSARGPGCARRWHCRATAPAPMNWWPPAASARARRG